MSDPARIVVGQLADADRRRVVAAIELGAAHVADVVARTGLPEPRATRALARLVDSGMVVASPAGFAVDHSMFAAAARELVVRPPSGEHDDRPIEVRRVFAAFVRDGRITGIPAARSKRLVLLDWLAQRFDPGRRYPEREVNTVLGEVHDDVAAWRRQLVDEGFLARTADGNYWRIGGSFTVDGGRQPPSADQGSTPLPDG